MQRPLPGTLGQIAAHIWSIFPDIEPTYQLADVTAIDDAFLTREGIDLVVWDIDGTLMGYHAREIAPQFAHQVAQLVQQEGVHHAVLSNCDERRFVELSTILPHVPIFRAYDTLDGWITRVRRGREDTHSDSAIRDLLAAGAYQVRKPDPGLVPNIMKALGVTDPRRTLVVGDQYLTDIATARLAGARSAKVRTFAPETFPSRIRFTQALERLLFAVTGLWRRRATSS